jgi:hypothetical protein
VAENPVRECQRGREDDVYTARSDRLLAAGSLRLAADEPHAADAVAADVHQRPAVEDGVKAGIAGAALCLEVERKGGPDGPHPADPA